MVSQEEVDKLNWFHKITLPNGVLTNGAGNTPLILSKLKLPADLTGKTVVDIGAFDGFYSFECEKRGATDILAVDSKNWGCGHYIGNRKECFNLAHKALNSKVRDLEVDFDDHKAEQIFGQFDIVLFLGILYHVDNPIQVLQNARKMTKELCIIETHVDMLDYPESATRFYPGSGNSLHWWGFNAKCVEAMALAAGFKRVELIELYDAGTGGAISVKGRGIFHCFV